MSWRARQGGLMKPEGVFPTLAGPELIFHVVFNVLVCFQSKKMTFPPPPLVTQLKIIGKEKLTCNRNYSKLLRGSFNVQLVHR